MFQTKPRNMVIHLSLLDYITSFYNNRVQQGGKQSKGL